MATAVPRQRIPAASAGGIPGPSLALGKTDTDKNLAHPSGKEKHSRLTQFLRGASFAIYFLSSCLALVPRHTI